MNNRDFNIDQNNRDYDFPIIEQPYPNPLTSQQPSAMTRQGAGYSSSTLVTSPREVATTTTCCRLMKHAALHMTGQEVPRVVSENQSADNYSSVMYAYELEHPR